MREFQIHLDYPAFYSKKAVRLLFILFVYGKAKATLKIIR